MPTPPLTLATRDYDFVSPLATGDVAADGLDLTLIHAFDALQRVAGDPAVQGGEASFSRYVQRFAAGDWSLVGLPLFVMREFRHRAFYVRRDSPLRTLGDLAGRRVAMDGWPNSGNTWSRALMQEEGVPLDRGQWMVGRVHAQDVAPPADALPRGVELSARPLRHLLRDGELDVLIWAWAPEGIYERDGPFGASSRTIARPSRAPTVGRESSRRTTWSCSSATSWTGILRWCVPSMSPSRRLGPGLPATGGVSTSRARGSWTTWRRRRESLRIVFGLKFIGMAETIYGLLLVLFIIFLPAGIYGSLARLFARRPAGAGA